LGILTVRALSLRRQARAFGKETSKVDMYFKRGRLIKLQTDRAQMELYTMLARLISAD